MRRKLSFLAGIGFVLGVAAFLFISCLFNRSPDGTIFFCSDVLLSRVGDASVAVVLQLMLSGLYGAACMAGSLFYDIEKWPLALATAMHYAVIALLYIPLAILSGWGLTPKLLFIIESLMTIGFFLIWLILYLRYKAEVRELNKLNEKRNKK